MSFGDTPQQQESALEKEQLRIAEDTWSRYKESFRPLENAMIDKIRTYDTEGYRQNKVGEAATAAKRTALDPKRGGTSGNFTGALLENTMQTGALAGQGGAETGQQTREQFYGGLASMGQLGQNQRKSASQGMTQLAGIQNTADRRTALLEAKEQQNLMSGIGNLAGIGGSYLTGGATGFDALSLSNNPMSSGFTGPPVSLAGTGTASVANPFMPTFGF